MKTCMKVFREASPLGQTWRSLPEGWAGRPASEDDQMSAGANLEDDLAARDRATVPEAWRADRGERAS
jgi:hypothetical protein